MKTMLICGIIKGTKVAHTVQNSEAPRSVGLELMVPVMRQGLIYGYQSLSDNDMTIYWGGLQ